MDFETSRGIEAMAAAESKLAKLETALAQMNAISKHQTNDALPPMIPFVDGKGFKQHLHPLTCGNDSNHTILFPFWTGEKVVLRCPDCDYVQSYLPGFPETAAPPLDEQPDGSDFDVGC